MDYTNNFEPFFNNELFLEKAITATTSYQYTYKNCAYLRFCFLAYYFEIDICRLHEEKYPHYQPLEEYNFEDNLKKTQKEFYYDIPRSNKSKNLFALKPYIDIFFDELQTKNFYGLYPDVKQHMQHVLINESDITTIISNYENFIAFFYKMIEYLNEYYTTKDNAMDSNYLTTFNNCAYSNNPEFYIDTLNNRYTYNVWNDVLCYPSYIILNEQNIIASIEKNYNYWNFIFENWNSFLLLSEEPSIWFSFKHLITKKDNTYITTSREINKLISSLLNEHDYSKTNFLLENAEKYACFLSIIFKLPHRDLEHVQKIASKKLNTLKEKSCFLFCKDNMDIISKLNEYHIRLLFRIACLATNTPYEVPRIDIDTFTKIITKSF